MAQKVDTTPEGGPAKDRFKKDRGRSEEVVSMRTQTSRTFVNELGAYETDMFPGSIHYRDSQRGWRRIDNDLGTSSAQGYSHENKRNRFSMGLPSNLGNRPARLTMGRHWVDLRLDGATGGPDVARNRGVYRDAVPGIDIVYEVLNDRVREDVILKDPDGPSDLSWTLRTSPSINPQENAVGGVDFVTDSGERIFSIPQALVYDAAGLDEGLAPAPPTFEVRDGGGAGYELSLALDEEWLRAPEREYPVTIDPDLEIGEGDPDKDCYIISGDRSGWNICGSELLRVGYDGTYKKRSLVRFQVGDNHFPSNAQVLNAEVSLYLRNASTSSSSQVNLRRLEPWWSQDATWNDRSANSAWDSPGGDFDGNSGYERLAVGPATDQRKYWFPTNLVQRFIAKGSSFNQGFILKQNDESTNQDFAFASFDNSDATQQPRLTVTWDQGGMGNLKNFEFEGRALSDRIRARVNVAGGNLFIQQNDFTIRGTGIDLVGDRFYNGLLETSKLDTDFPMGDGWNLGTGGDVGLVEFADPRDMQGSADPTGNQVAGVALFGPSGYRLPFTKDVDNGKFTSPAGLNATLTYQGGDTDRYILKLHGNEQRYVFSGGGKLLFHRSKNPAQQLIFRWDETNPDRLASIEDSQGRATTFHYADGLLDSIIDPVGREHRYYYESVTDASGASHDLLRRYEFAAPDATGAVVAVNETRYEYDGEQRLVRLIDPAGNSTKFSYVDDSTFRDRYVKSVTYVTDPAADTGDTTTFSYQNSDSTVCPDAEVDKAPLATVVDGPRSLSDNDLTRYCYTELSRVKTIKDAHENVTTMDYDANANVTSYQNANGVTFDSDYTLDSGNLIGTTSPDDSAPDAPGSSSEVKYQDPDHPNLPTLITDAQGHQKHFEYDQHGNVTKTIQGYGSGAESTYSYTYNYGDSADGSDAALQGTLARIEAPPVETDSAAQGNDTVFDYYEAGVNAGQIEQIHYPVPNGSDPVGPVTITYDDLSRIDTITDRSGRVTDYDYDGQDRIVEITYDANGASLSSVAYEYDDAGNVILRTDSDPNGNDSTSAYTYTPKNELESETHGTQTVDYDYTPSGDLKSLTSPQGETTYSYDSVNVLTKMVVDKGETSEKMITFDHNELYQHTNVNYPNGKSAATRYFGSGRVKKVLGLNNDANDTKFRELTYGWSDDAGNVRGLIQSIKDENSKKTTSFTYDALNRLTKERTEKNDASLDRVFNYNYDDRSNLTCADRNGDVTRFTYGDHNELVSSFPTGSCGGSATGPETAYSYDANGNLMTVDAPDDTADMNFDYNARDHTTSITKGDTTTDMTYRGPTQDERTTAATGSDVTSYEYDLLGIESESDASTSTEYFRTNEGKVIGFQQGSKTRYFVTDHLGSVTDVIAGNSDIVQKYTYEPYGDVWWAKDQTGDFFNPWRFAKGYLDTDTQLYKLGTRYYDTGFGAFTQEDPKKGELSDPVTLNLYQYAKGDPINKSDPTGRDAACFWAATGLYMFSMEVAFGVGTIIGGITLEGATLGVSTAAVVAGAANVVWGTIGVMESADAMQASC